MRFAPKSFIVLAFILFSAAFCSRSGAQAYSASCDIPFAFEMGTHHMSAGHYTITRGATGTFLRLQSATSSGYTLPIRDDDNVVSSDDRLVFTRVGGQSYLKELRRAHTSQFLEWPTSRAQKQQMLVQQTAPSTAVVALVKTQR